MVLPNWPERVLKFILADLPAEALIEVADSPLAARTLIFNIGASDDVLREEKCRGNVVHVAPTRSMLADGLAQYLVWKQWRKWFLVLGSHPEDRLWAEALKHSATRFGAKIVEERVYEDRGGARRSDSGVTLVQKEMPAFTQGAAAHDVLVAADESAVFADYALSHLGSASGRRVRRARPDLLGPLQRAMGRTQLQQRFEKKFQRFMSPLDMNGWTAARMIGEAAAHGAAEDALALKAFLLSKDFTLPPSRAGN